MERLEELLDRSPWLKLNNREYQVFQYDGQKFMRWREEPREWIPREPEATPRTVPGSRLSDPQGGAGNVAGSPSNPGIYKLSGGVPGSGRTGPSSPPRELLDLPDRTIDDRSVVLSIEPDLTVKKQGGAPKGDRLSTRLDAAKFFTEGRIFKVWWPVPAGRSSILSGRGRGPNDTNPPETYDSYRRMAVVRWRKGYCICIPIYTYSYQGVAKSGLTQDERRRHAVIYMVGDSDKESNAERDMMNKTPIKVTPANAQQKLQAMSRVNFGQPQTVAWNVEVVNIGKVSDDSMEDFLEYYDDENKREGPRSPPNKKKGSQNPPRS